MLLQTTSYKSVRCVPLHIGSITSYKNLLTPHNTRAQSYVQLRLPIVRTSLSPYCRTLDDAPFTLSVSVYLTHNLNSFYFQPNLNSSFCSRLGLLLFRLNLQRLFRSFGGLDSLNETYTPILTNRCILKSMIGLDFIKMLAFVVVLTSLPVLA